VFNARRSPNDIAIEHVKFYIRNCWFMDSKWKMFAFCISIYGFSFIVKFIVFGIWFCIHNSLHIYSIYYIIHMCDAYNSKWIMI
jgi:hypothetical protein